MNVGIAKLGNRNQRAAVMWQPKGLQRLWGQLAASDGLCMYREKKEAKDSYGPV